MKDKNKNIPIYIAFVLLILSSIYYVSSKSSKSYNYTKLQPNEPMVRTKEHAIIDNIKKNTKNNFEQDILTNNIIYPELDSKDEINKINAMDQVVGVDIKLKQKIISLIMAKPDPNRGIFKSVLLSGPPGTGKTMLAMAICKQFKMIMIEVKNDIISGRDQADSLKRLAAIFDVAKKIAKNSTDGKNGTKCMIFIDEMDSIFGLRNIVIPNELNTKKLALITDYLKEANISKENNIIIIGATNFPEKIDSALVDRTVIKATLSKLSIKHIVDLIKKEITGTNIEKILDSDIPANEIVHMKNIIIKSFTKDSIRLLNSMEPKDKLVYLITNLGSVPNVEPAPNEVPNEEPAPNEVPNEEQDPNEHVPNVEDLNDELKIKINEYLVKKESITKYYAEKYLSEELGKKTYKKLSDDKTIIKYIDILGFYARERNISARTITNNLRLYNFMVDDDDENKFKDFKDEFKNEFKNDIIVGNLYGKRRSLKVNKKVSRHKRSNKRKRSNKHKKRGSNRKSKKRGSKCKSKKINKQRSIKK
jgi:AAA+ superfamily predicted ATPase